MPSMRYYPFHHGNKHFLLGYTILTHMIKLIPSLIGNMVEPFAPFNSFAFIFEVMSGVSIPPKLPRNSTGPSCCWICLKIHEWVIYSIKVTENLHLAPTTIGVMRDLLTPFSSVSFGLEATSGVSFLLLLHALEHIHVTW